MCSPTTCQIVSSFTAAGATFITCGPMNPALVKCVRKAGSGLPDPHLTGFDGLTFDFHGIHGRNYVVFGRLSGDILVSKMRETQRIHHASGAKATLFDEFGLQIADSNDHVRVYLARESLQEGHWLPKVEVNKKEIKEGLNLKSCRVNFRSGEKWVSIITKDSKFLIFAGRPEDENVHHLNIKISLTKRPSSVESYIGILGVTLNHALGHEINPDLDVTGRTEMLETALRGRFEVESLFPRLNSGHNVVLTGLVRMLENSEIVEKAWSAGTV